MPYGDLARIHTNVGAMHALNALNYVNRELGIHQLRIATGKAMTSVGESPAAYSIGKELEGTARRWRQAVANIQDVQNLMSTAETGATTIKDILVRMSELCSQASSDILSDDDRLHINEELQALAKEIDQTVDLTKWRDIPLLNGEFSASRYVWVGPSAATTDRVEISFTAVCAGLNWSVITGITVGQICVSTSTAAASLLASIIHALTTVDSQINQIGTFEERFALKEVSASEHEVDVWASYSRIMSADMAKEQLAVTKFTILQQAAIAGLAQANTAPSFVLGLLGG